MKSQRPQRQRRIVQLLKEQSITSQMQLVKLLRSSGVPATQATVSRDLEDLGAVKVRKDGKVTYALPTESKTPPSGDALRLILAESVLDLESSGNLVLIKTPPGHSGMVASAIDRAELEGIAGTVAGDDTIIVVCKQGVLPRRVEKRLRDLSGMLPISEIGNGRATSARGGGAG